MAESKMNNNAVNYNCLYDKETGNLIKDNSNLTKGSYYGKSCSKDERKYSTSIDKCIFQLNSIHGEYPTIESCVRKAKELRDTYSYTQWSVYNNGSYKKYLQ